MSEEASTNDGVGLNNSNGGLSNILLNFNILSTPLSPMYNNIYASIITILYVKIVMEIGAYIRIKYGVPELSRKFVHLCACQIVLFWGLFDVNHWGWRLNVTVPVVMSLRLLYKVSMIRKEIILCTSLWFDSTLNLLCIVKGSNIERSRSKFVVICLIFFKAELI